MYPTAEVRWFHRGPTPAEMEIWFRTREGRVEREPARADQYLRLRGSDGVNIKLREGRIEIKQRVGETNVVHFHQQVSGIVERWRKWSFELARSESDRSQTPTPASAWIGVRKERELRTYAVQSDKRVIPLHTLKSPAQGCELELTSVRAAGQMWWTLALEAFGDESRLQDNLVQVAEHVFSSDASPYLEVSHSRGYAAWLATLFQSENNQR